MLWHAMAQFPSSDLCSIEVVKEDLETIQMLRTLVGPTRPGERLHFAMENHHAINGKIH